MAYNRGYTPEKITRLQDNEIFVFGSNLAGRHAGGAARTAHNCFGAIWGLGVGPQGQCYAIPTMHGGPQAIKPYIDQFINYALEHSQQLFLVTRIGCGIAGYTPQQIAPLFTDALHINNVILPKDFVEIILDIR